MAEKLDQVLPSLPDFPTQAGVILDGRRKVAIHQGTPDCFLLRERGQPLASGPQSENPARVIEVAENLEKNLGG